MKCAVNENFIKALVNEDTLLRTHCSRHKCFPVCPSTQHLLRTQILCPGHKKCFWFCSETFCVRNKCFPVCAVQETSWATMCRQRCVLVYQGLKTDVEIMIEVLRLAWIPRLLTPEIRNWKTMHYLRKTGGLNSILRCNYDVKYIDGLPLFYKDILTFFSELKGLYCYERMQDMVLFITKTFSSEEDPFLLKDGLIVIFCPSGTCWTVMVSYCLSKNLITSMTVTRIFFNSTTLPVQSQNI